MRGVLSPHPVSSHEFQQFAVSKLGGSVEIYRGNTCIHVARSTSSIYLDPDTEIVGWRFNSLELFLKFFRAFGTSPLAYIEITDEAAPKGSNLSNDVIEKIIEKFGGADINRLESLPSMETGAPDVDTLSWDYFSLVIEDFAVVSKVKEVKDMLKQQGYVYSCVLPESYAPQYQEMQIRLYSTSVAFLYHFANYAFKFKHGDHHVTYDFDVKRVLQVFREKQFDLKQLEAETGDSVVPVGLVDESAFICIGLTGWFYQAEKRSTDGKLVWQPIGENAQEAWVAMYSGVTE